MDRGPWYYGVTADSKKPKRVFLASNDFTHDVRLYIDGDFGSIQDKKLYASNLVARLNSPVVTKESVEVYGVQIPLPPEAISGNDVLADRITISKQRLAEIIKDSVTAYHLGMMESSDTLKRFEECGGYEEPDPVERLRFFFSLALKNPADWLDSEQFFDDVLNQRRALTRADQGASVKDGDND